MAIKYKIYQSEFPYHIFNRTNNKEHLFDLEHDFPVFMMALKRAAERTEIRPHHFILMGNHYHLIASTPHANLNVFMHNFQTVVSKTLNQKKERLNHVFGSRYGASVVKSEYYLSQLIRYVYQNPVKAGICESPFMYPFSSIKHYFNTVINDVFSYDPYLLSIRTENRLDELKRLIVLSLADGDQNLIKTRLRKPVFSLYE